jgi:hypothetical protein
MLLEWLIVAHGKVPVQFVTSENSAALDLTYRGANATQNQNWER